jgi:hypothetical protein
VRERDARGEPERAEREQQVERRAQRVGRGDPAGKGEGQRGEQAVQAQLPGPGPRSLPTSR